ncbi:unnamed protein product [Lampetra planeri]
MARRGAAVVHSLREVRGLSPDSVAGFCTTRRRLLLLLHSKWTFKVPRHVTRNEDAVACRRDGPSQNETANYSV